MIAYVFWHRPAPGVVPARYEETLAAFHATLASDPPDGFLGSRVYRLPHVPWLPASERPGPARLDAYEDAYLLEGSAALDPLDRAAVTGAREAAHAAVTRLAGEGRAGLYGRRREGSLGDGPSDALWLSKPRRAAYAGFLEELEGIAGEGVAIWQRKMVLGPAPEFVLLGPPNAFRPGDLPGAWNAVLVRREPVWLPPRAVRPAREG